MMRRRTYRPGCVRDVATWHLPPPADLVTPAIARRWLRETFPRLGSLGMLGHYPAALDGRASERDSLRLGLASIAGDAHRIARGCAEALATGRTVPMRREPRHVAHRGTIRALRLAARFEERHPHGLARLLRRAVALEERAAVSERAERRSPRKSHPRASGRKARSAQGSR